MCLTGDVDAEPRTEGVVASRGTSIGGPDCNDRLEALLADFLRSEYPFVPGVNDINSGEDG